MPMLDGTAALWVTESAPEWAHQLTQALGETAPYWDANGLMWGAYDNHCIEFSVDDEGHVEQLRIRIDLRQRDVRLVEDLLAFAREHDLLLLTGDGEPVEPRIDQLAAVAQHSAAARFVRDPIAFLESLPKIS